MLDGWRIGVIQEKSGQQQKGDEQHKYASRSHREGLGRGRVGGQKELPSCL
jgi:hypothetical protein